MYETSLESIKNLLSDKYQRCESRSLRLEKFVRLGGNTKKEEIDAVCNRKALPVSRLNLKRTIPIYAKLESRLIVNQASGVLENAGICLHRYFGYPIIPGSAVKGIAHHAAWSKWNDITDEDEKFVVAKRIAEIFGFPTNDKDIDDFLNNKGWKNKKRSGLFCFMSAIPKDNADLVCDVINSHHSKYYSNPRENQAKDNESPIPNFFLAVEKGAIFKFEIVYKRDTGNDLKEDVKKYLLEGITNHGIGAKTAAGYGWFVDVTESELKKEKERDEREKQKREFEDLEKKINAFDEELKYVETMTSEQKDKYDYLKRIEEYKSVDGYQKVIEKLNKLVGKLPKESFRDKLISCAEKEFIGQYIKRFDKIKDNSQKEEIVKFLQEGEGKGKSYWDDLRKPQKGDTAKGVNAIRVYCKDVMKLGKMP